MVYMPIYRFVFILILLLTSHMSQGQAVVTVLEMQQQQGHQQQNYFLYLSKERVANLNERGQLQELYDLATKTLYVLDHQQKNYRRFNLPKAKAYAEALNAMLTKFEAKLKLLPKVQRKKQTDRLNQFFNGGKANRLMKSEYSAIAKQGQFAGVTCDWYEITQQQALSGQACVANPNSFKHGATLLAMLQSMNEIYSVIIGSAQGRLHLNIANNPMAPLAQLAKIPVSIEGKTSGIKVQLTSVQEINDEMQIFNLPKNFTEFKDNIDTALAR